MIKKTINNVSFDKLKKLEITNGFNENKSPNLNHRFFKEGKKEQWKKKLPNKLQNMIEETFKNEMIENQYII